MIEALGILGLGFAAGLTAGLFGVGGGILFVPTLLGLGLGQLDAEATSLLAILPTVVAGTWRNRRYGNVRWRPAVLVGVASILGVQAGGLVSAGAQQLAFLRTERWDEVERTVDRIERRFGPGAASPASLLGRNRRP